MLERSLIGLKRMSSSGAHQSSVDIAYDQAIQGFETRQIALNKELQSLHELESTLGNSQEPPSHSPLRQAVISRYDKLVVELQDLHEEFTKHSTKVQIMILKNPGSYLKL